MASLESIGTEIVDYINNHYQSNNLYSYVLTKVNSLTYTKTGLPLSVEDREKLGKIVQFKLEFGSDKNIGDTVFLGESESSKAFLDLVELIKMGNKQC